MASLPGIWAVHRFAGLYGGIELNRRRSANPAALQRWTPISRPRVWPWWKVDQIDGLQSAADPEDVRDLVVGRPQEVPRRSFRRGKTIVYTGRVKGRTLDELEDGIEAARLAWFDEQYDGLLELYSPGYDYANRLSDTRYRLLYAKAINLDVVGQVSGPGLHVRSFVAAVRTSYPYSLGPTNAVANIAALVDPPEEKSVLVNPGGKVPCDPVIRVNGRNYHPDVRNDTIGRKLSFNGTRLPSGGGLLFGEWMDIDFRNRTITHSNGSEVSEALIYPDSDWWDAGVPGLNPNVNNTIVLRDRDAQPAYTAGQGSTASITSRPTYP